MSDRYYYCCHMFVDRLLWSMWIYKGRVFHKIGDWNTRILQRPFRTVMNAAADLTRSGFYSPSQQPLPAALICKQRYEARCTSARSGFRKCFLGLVYGLYEYHCRVANLLMGIGFSQNIPSSWRGTRRYPADLERVELYAAGALNVLKQNGALVPSAFARR